MDKTPIPRISPIAVLGQTDSSRTRPIKMRCDTGQGIEDYIVKLWANVELKSHSLAREAYGSLLALQFGLVTPKFALVDIPPKFGDTQADRSIRDSLNRSPGLNFGSYYLEQSFQPCVPIANSQLSKAARVFCFDMLIWNVDRRDPKINLFATADNFILYDHEQAFPYSRPTMYVGGFPGICSFKDEDWSKKHIFFPSLRDKDLRLEIEEFILDLLRLDKGIFATIESQIPAEWKTTDLRRISDCLSEARAKADLFKRNLQEILS